MIVKIQLFKKENIRCGLITAIAKEELMDKRHRWASMGFMSRILPVSYSYTMSTVMKILESIVNREYHNEEKEKLKLRKKEKKIELSPKIAEKLLPFSVQFGKARDIYGFRLQKQLQVLLQASALMDDRKTVNNKDLEKVLSLTRYMNLEFNAI